MAGKPLSLTEKSKRYTNAKIWPTFRCTLACPDCGAKDGRRCHPDYELSWGQYTRFIDRLREQNIRLGLLDFSGGEPTLWPHLKEAIRYAHQARVCNLPSIKTKDPLFKYWEPISAKRPKRTIL